MRQRIRLGLWFLLSATVIGTLAAPAGADVFVVLVLLVILVQRSLLGHATADVRSRLAVLAGIGLVFFVALVVLRVRDILAS
jgi:uncharacterized membrane protein